MTGKMPATLPGASLAASTRFGTSTPATFTGKKTRWWPTTTSTPSRASVYSRGQDISATPAGQKVLDKHARPSGYNNSYWLLMPFKLKDSGVTLTYKGEAKTMDGAARRHAAADLQERGRDAPEPLRSAGEPRHRPRRGMGLFCRQATDAQPAFRRRWNEYARHGQLLLAADRSEATKPARLDNIAQLQTLPEGVMTQSQPSRRSSSSGVMSPAVTQYASPRFELMNQKACHDPALNRAAAASQRSVSMGAAAQGCGQLGIIFKLQLREHDWLPHSPQFLWPERARG